MARSTASDVEGKAVGDGLDADTDVDTELEDDLVDVADASRSRK